MSPIVLMKHHLMRVATHITKYVPHMHLKKGGRIHSTRRALGETTHSKITRGSKQREPIKTSFVSEGGSIRHHDERHSHPAIPVAQFSAKKDGKKKQPIRLLAF